MIQVYIKYNGNPEIILSAFESNLSAEITPYPQGFESVIDNIIYSLNSETAFEVHRDLPSLESYDVNTEENEILLTFADTVNYPIWWVCSMALLFYEVEFHIHINMKEVKDKIVFGKSPHEDEFLVDHTNYGELCCRIATIRNQFLQLSQLRVYREETVNGLPQ